MDSIVLDHYRKTIGGTQVMAKENTLDRMLALKLITSGGYGLVKEPLKGKIQKGYFADLVTRQRLFHSCLMKKIPITSKMTIVDGSSLW